MSSTDYRRLGKNRTAVIHAKPEHKRYLAELERLFHKPSLTAAEQRYSELLALLIEVYEKRSFPLKSKAIQSTC